MSHADMAKEVGLSGATLERSLKIERSNLPEEIKEATFKGRIGIEPTADLLKEPELVQKQAVARFSLSYSSPRRPTKEKRAKKAYILSSSR